MGIETLFGKNFQKGSVVICHVTSLHDPVHPFGIIDKGYTSYPRYGVGELGSAALELIDFLSETGTSAWQILPFGHTGYGNSPYQTFSRFAGSPYMISIERLLEAGDLDRNAHDRYVESLAGKPTDVVDFGWLFRRKVGSNWNGAILRIAYEGFSKKGGERKDDFYRFCSDNAYWLDNYAEYMAIKEQHRHKGWNEWDKEFQNAEAWRDQNNQRQILARCASLGATIEFYKYLQFLFFSQWGEVRRYANSKGIKIIGDLPWYVGYDSADVWAQRNVFKLGEDYAPQVVAGVPPDYFSPTGQLWGNPIYNWKNPQTYAWWQSSIEFLLRSVDIIRWDHARALDTYWEIPMAWVKEHKDARGGYWCKGPGRDLLNCVKAKLGFTDASGQLPFIFEDLGYLDTVYAAHHLYPNDFSEDKKFKIDHDFQEMLYHNDPHLYDGRLRDGGYSPRQALDRIMGDNQIPYMCVAQFGVNKDGIDDPRLYAPNWPYLSVGYAGTHDNNTTVGWCQELGIDPGEFAHEVKSMVMNSKSVLAGFQWQDLWGLDAYYRFNLPNDMTREGGWWSVRLTREQMAKAITYGPGTMKDQLRVMNRWYGRTYTPPNPLQSMDMWEAWKQFRQDMLNDVRINTRTEAVDRIENIRIPGPAGEIPLRIYRPKADGDLPVVIYYHGGAFCVGNLDTHDNICAAIANRTPCTVVAVDYRLAPEHRFPAALDDAYAAYLWVAQHMSIRLAVAGDSAGGTLATVVAMKARDEKGPSITYQVLFYPLTNMRDLNTKSYAAFANGYGLSRSEVAVARSLYAPNEKDWALPYASPFLATNFQNLPNGFVATAEYDMLRDEGEAYVELLRKAWIQIKHIRYNGVPHGFLSKERLFGTVANQAIDKACESLWEVFFKA